MDIRLFPACIFLSAIICRTIWGCRTRIPHGHVRGHCVELCSYWCEEGYEKDLDTPFLDCDVNNNTWVHYDDDDDRRVSEEQLCRPKRCPDITIPNGDLSECVPTVGASCSYSCQPGYSQLASHISCLPSTEWSENPLVLCTSHQQCPHEIPRGALNVSCSRNPGDTCSFSCDVGMITDVRSKTLTCGRKSKTSSWNKALDSVCTNIRCPVEIPNGHVTNACARDFEDVCYFQCYEGFVRSKVAFLKCNGSAQWEWFAQTKNPTLCLDKSKLCPKLIENGEIVKYCDRYIGNQCSYSCDRGCYKNKEVFKLTCDSSLTWQPQTPLCWDCGVGTCNQKIPHGRIGSPGCQEHCLYYCDRGYEESLKLRMLKCSINNIWAPAYEDRYVSENDLCNAKSCPNITIIPNGEVGNCPGKVDTTCSYSCSTGYHQKSSEISCLKTTEWDSNLHALCTNAMQCPYKISNGALNMLCSRNPGETCTYSCDEGHLPVDMSMTITCGSDSSWDRPLHSICPDIKCPVRIPHGSISLTCLREYEDNCGYNCDEGYEKPDNYYLKCNGSAQWEIRWSWLQESPVFCTPKRCSEVHIPNGEVLTCNMTVDSSCSYSCKTGYNQTMPHVTCMPSQTWDPPPHTLCVNKTQCPHAIPRGELNATCGRNYGEMCHYSCYEGAIAFNTSRTITCGANASWDIPLETICTVIECPANIVKAKLSPSCDRGYNDECLYYTCPPGYDKESLPVRMRCNESSKWEVEWNKQQYVGELCMARSCPKLYVPNGKRGKCLAKVDSVCSYICDDGYRKKSQSVTCLSNQQWDLDMHSLCTNSEQCEQYQIPNGHLDINCGRNPGYNCSFTCDRGMMPRSGTVYCHNKDSYWDKNFQTLCSVLRCPNTIPGGYLSISHCGRSLNDRCYTFMCYTGFEKVYHYSSNRPYLRCNESAQWEIHWKGDTPPIQLCLDKSKMCPSTIKNGTISRVCQRTVGAKCSYTCDRYCSKTNYYSILTCMYDFTWDYEHSACSSCYIPTTPVPVCSGTIPHGRISVFCRRHINRNCTYYCDYGCRSTRTTLYCTTHGYWSDRYSACDCDYRATTATYNNADIYDSDDKSEPSSGLTTILIILGVLVFLVVVCVFIYALKKQQYESPVPTPQPSSDTPVLYHPVTTNTPVVTNGRRDSPPNYNSIARRDHRNLDPLLPDTPTAPSAPEGPAEGAGSRMSQSASGIDLDGYPPPPSYIEVVSDPDKYQTHTIHEDLQAE